VYGAVGYQPLDHQRIAEFVSSGVIFQEVPLGEGKVDFDAYFAALQESDTGNAPERDIERAVSFILQYR
jgi:sugar phosphate isomerase/epimerase